MNAVNNQTYVAQLQGLSHGRESNRNRYIQTLSKCLGENSCPMTLRKLKEAQHSYEGVRLRQPDGQNIRIKTLSAATVGSIFTLATRVVRCAVRTAALPLSIPYSFEKAARYNLTNEVTDELKRTGQEWVDMGVSLLCVPMGLCKTWNPDWFRASVDSLGNYYVKRIDERTARDNYVERQIGRFVENHRQIKEAWSGAVRPPVLAN